MFGGKWAYLFEKNKQNNNKPKQTPLESSVKEMSLKDETM